MISLLSALYSITEIHMSMLAIDDGGNDEPLRGFSQEDDFVLSGAQAGNLGPEVDALSFAHNELRVAHVKYGFTTPVNFERSDPSIGNLAEWSSTHLRSGLGMNQRTPWLLRASPLRLRWHAGGVGSDQRDETREHGRELDEHELLSCDQRRIGLHVGISNSPCLVKRDLDRVAAIGMSRVDGNGFVAIQIDVVGRVGEEAFEAHSGI